ncbi:MULTISPECIES: sugar phosphate nucleotidyltransferase [Pseudomonas]|uniref:Nucleoside-diphosphate-sugar pyrophosphorylase family protein n=1 Tax=Pseudomonas asplenii TaxID=53407 RepID=A0A0M9GG22_9PSED|nr:MULTISPECIES: sugar phosphate nucleotidyltransferase [Pseudomonas]KPA90023.1 Nucleoside-diphosphate-sugar pyrophosphorylase family protein [Pseudomonas fuscovaginae]KPA94793.1 Nucleoside-diphosphate-sugar pyrophosphorylase family protein [Pseudomonas fuscovaginae]
MTVRTAIILAGGLGTRLRSVVSSVPKPMAPINGRPFLEYLLDYWIEQGISRFILSVGYQCTVITEHFGGRYRSAEVEYAIEHERLGTGGGLLLAAAMLKDEDAFVLLNGDTFFAVELAALDRFARKAGSDWALSLFRAEEANRYMGLELTDEQRILSLASQRGLPGCLANGGVYWVRRDSLASSPFVAGNSVSLEDELLPTLLARGACLSGFAAEGSFIDIGIPHDYQRAGQVLNTSELRG